jgi:hypothetical protein
MDCFGFLGGAFVLVKVFNHLYIIRAKGWGGGDDLGVIRRWPAKVRLEDRGGGLGRNVWGTDRGVAIVLTVSSGTTPLVPVGVDGGTEHPTHHVVDGWVVGWDLFSECDELYVGVCAEETLERIVELPDKVRRGGMETNTTVWAAVLESTWGEFVAGGPGQHYDSIDVTQVIGFEFT